MPHRSSDLKMRGRWVMMTYEINYQTICESFLFKRLMLQNYYSVFRFKIAVSDFWKSYGSFKSLRFTNGATRSAFCNSLIDAYFKFEEIFSKISMAFSDDT